MNLCDEKVLLCYGVQYYFTLEILYNYLCEPVRKLIYTHTHIYIYYVIDVTLITLLSFQFVCFL